ncbi:MAG: hypothetical protein H6R07_1225 [Proteobacteria bacterium]|nr:hypothetical protein [Pseudomonadota bacterium]
MFKLVILLVLLGVICSLFSGLFFLFKNRGADDDRSVKALTVRIALSLVLFALLMLGFYFGLIPGHAR